MSQGSSGTGIGGVTPEFMQGADLGTSGGGGSTVTPPGAADSAYQYEYYVANLTVQVGSQVAQMLGIAAGPYSASQIYQHMADLSQSQLVQFQHFLYQAGFYTDGQGQPLQGMTFGSLDNQSFMALANAVTNASNSQTSLDNAAAVRIGSGQGQNAQTSMPQAVTGGGHVYNIDLTDPAAVRATATQIFQSALGRAPSEAEMGKIADAVRSGELSQGLAHERGSENASQAIYQTEVNQRNTAFNFAHNPRVALGAVPNGPFTDPIQASIGLLQYMNLPVTQSNLQFLSGLSSAVNGSGMNLWGVQNKPSGGFQSWAQSIQATAQNLMNSGFGNVMAHLSAGDAGNVVSDPNVQAELKKWGVSGGDITQQVNDAASKSAEAAFYYGVNQSQAQGQPAMGPGAGGIKQAELTNQDPQNFGSPATPGQPGATPNTIPAADVTPGQSQMNPGDAYINPTTVYSTNPLSADQAAFDAATTGANRISYAGHIYLNGFRAIAQALNGGSEGGG